jgi:hypothetical protein
MYTYGSYIRKHRIWFARLHCPMFPLILGWIYFSVRPFLWFALKLPHFQVSNREIFFFGFEETSPLYKVYFVGPGEEIKSRLFQALTKNACPDSNSKSAVQILNPLPSNREMLTIHLNKLIFSFVLI